MRRRTSTSQKPDGEEKKPKSKQTRSKQSAKDRAAAALAPSAKVVDPVPEQQTLKVVKKLEEVEDEGSGQKSSDHGNTRVSKLAMTGYENIIDNLFTVDPDALYGEVVECLELDSRASRTDYGHLVEALDRAESNVEKALRLVANAKVTYAAYSADVKVIEGELHSQAAREIQEAYEDPDNKEVTKKPTVADVEAYKASTYHDEYADCKTRLEKAKRSVEYLEGLQKAVSERARDLRQMCAGARGA